MADEGAPNPGGGKWDGPTEYHPPAFLFARRLGFRLALLVMVAVVPLFTLAVLSELRGRDEAVRSADKELGRLARIAARNQEEAIAQANRVLDAAALQSWTGGNPSDVSRELREIAARNPGFLDLHVARPDGGVVASVLPEGESKALFDPKVAGQALSRKAAAAGDFERVPGGPPRVFLARPLPDGNVLGASFTLGWLELFQGLLSLPDGSVLDVVDPQGLNLLRLPRSGKGDVGQIHPAPQLLRSVVPGESLPMVAEDTDGVRRYFGIAPLATGGVRKGVLVVVGIPEAEIVSTANSAMRTSLILSAIVLILSLVLAQVMAEQFVLKRVNGLILATRRLATTDLSKLRARVRVCQDPSELGDLERAFDDMARNIEAHARELGGGKKA